MISKIATVVLALTIMLAVGGCNAYQKAEAAYHVIESILNLAKAEVPTLQTAGIYSAQDSALAMKYISFVGTLNDQYGTCVTNAQNAMLSKKGKFLACLTAFVGGLADPNELAALRIMNPSAQKRIQLYVVAFQTGLNIAITSLGGKQTPPAATGLVAPTVAETHEFELQVREQLTIRGGN